MNEMNMVYELIAEAKRKELQSVSTISVLATTATNSKGVM